MLLCRTVNTGFGLDWRRLLAETDAELFEQWKTAYRYEPWADERLDEAVGHIIANAHEDHGVNPKPHRKYMRYLQSEEAMQSEEDMKRIIGKVCESLERENGH